MRDQPACDMLLDTARDLLRDEVLPTLPPSQRHGALMIANAMAIAMRQLKSGDDPEREELDSLRRILALRGGDEPDADAPLAQGLAERNRALCRLIRAGWTDEGSLRDEVRVHLLRTTRQRVAISNPRYLEGGR